jgi:hypothetical protein
MLVSVASISFVSIVVSTEISPLAVVSVKRPSPSRSEIVAIVAWPPNGISAFGLKYFRSNARAVSGCAVTKAVSEYPTSEAIASIAAPSRSDASSTHPCRTAAAGLLRDGAVAQQFAHVGGV